MPDPDVLMSDLELYDTIWELRRAPEFIEVRTAALDWFGPPCTVGLQNEGHGGAELLCCGGHGVTAGPKLPTI